MENLSFTVATTLAPWGLTSTGTRRKDLPVQGKVSSQARIQKSHCAVSLQVQVVNEGERWSSQLANLMVGAVSRTWRSRKWAASPRADSDESDLVALGFKPGATWTLSIILGLGPEGYNEPGIQGTGSYGSARQFLMISSLYKQNVIM